jgi:octaprenyl-diphosphate synthase
VTARARPASAGQVSLSDIQAPVAPSLARVGEEMWRIVAVDSALLNGVSEHLMLMKGKMLRPTLLLLSSEVDGGAEARAASYAAVVELIHLATLVHDDAVDHSVLRRGMPTINALFTHQVAVIAGDFLYSRAVQELVRLGDLEALRVFAKASNELTLGEMRQLSALDALQFNEDDYEFLIRAKTAALFSGACEVGALCGAARHRGAMAAYGSHLGMPTGLDLKEHKVTLPLIAALRSMSKGSRAAVDDLFASAEPDDTQIARVIDIVIEEGGLDYARERGERYASRADDVLAQLPESPARRALQDTLTYVMERRA